MSCRTPGRRELHAAVFALLLGASFVVVEGASAQTADEAKCHATIAKLITKYQATLAKNLVACHKQRSAGLTSNDCNSAAGADLKGKRTTTRASILATIDATCSPSGLAVRNLYPRCPSPSASSDDGGATTGIDSYGEVADCLMDLSEAYVDRAGAEVMGAPTGPFPISDGTAKCQGAIGKALSKAIKTVGKTYSKCQKGQEKLGAGLDFDASCLGAAGDPKGKAASAIAAIGVTALDGSCWTDNMPSQATWASLRACGQSVTEMKLCAVDRVADPVSRGLVAAALELPGTCASFATVHVNAAYGDKLSETRLDLGFSGLGHDLDVLDQSRVGVSLQGCDADCANCEVDFDTTDRLCRCDNSATTVCDTINGPDADDCGGNTCRCMLAPPLPLNAGGAPICTVNRISQQLTGGTTGFGEYAVALRTREVVYLGLEQLRPCPLCDGDADPNSGDSLGGTCSGGGRNGLACDENAEHPDFGPTSFDCPPSPAANVSGTGLNHGLTLTSGTASFTSAISSASFCTGGTCHCSLCSGDFSVGCASNTDCDFAAVAEGGVVGSKGTCGVNLGGSNPRPNGCEGASPTCEPAGLGMGTCDSDGANTGPVDFFCSGALRENGEGILPCASQADCDAFDVLCGGDCGTCSVPKTRSCFLPLVSATGEAGIFNSEAVSVSCSARTSNAGINAAYGLPGPGRLKLDLDFDLYCSDGTTRFQLPGGSNCP